MTTSTEREMHWIMTVQFERHGYDQPAFYLEGTITPEPGQTRQDVFREVFNVTLSHYQGSMTGPSVSPIPVFFSLEPNELPGRDDQ